MKGADVMHQEEIIFVKRVNHKVINLFINQYEVVKGIDKLRMYINYNVDHDIKANLVDDDLNFIKEVTLDLENDVYVNI